MFMNLSIFRMIKVQGDLLNLESLGRVASTHYRVFYYYIIVLTIARSAIAATKSNGKEAST